MARLGGLSFKMANGLFLSRKAVAAGLQIMAKVRGSAKVLGLNLKPQVFNLLCFSRVPVDDGLTVAVQGSTSW